MNKDLKKAMNLLKQEIKYAKTSESDSLTGIIARFDELETVVKNCSIPDVSNTFVCKECGNNKKAVDTTLGVHRCSKCRSNAN